MGTLLYALLYTFRRRNNPDVPYRHFRGGEQPNAGAQPRPKAEARHERKLKRVGCNIPCPHGQSPPQKQGRIMTPR